MLFYTMIYLYQGLLTLQVREDMLWNRNYVSGNENYALKSSHVATMKNDEFWQPVNKLYLYINETLVCV